MATFLDDLFSVALYLVGARISKGKGINLSAAFTAALNPNSGNVDVGLSGSGAAAALSGQSLSLSNLTLSGTLTQGPFTRYTFGGSASPLTTTGGGSIVLFTFPLAANSAALMEFSAGGFSASGAFTDATTLGSYFSSHSPSGLYGPQGNVTQKMGITPAIVPVWSAGTLTVTAYGPTATITAIDGSGAGGTCRITVAAFHGLDPFDNTISTVSVTIAGVTGTTEANGTHTATFVDTTHIDINVTFVHAYTGGPGTVALATPPVISWVGWYQFGTPS